MLDLDPVYWQTTRGRKKGYVRRCIGRSKGLNLVLDLVSDSVVDCVLVLSLKVLIFRSSFRF